MRLRTDHSNAAPATVIRFDRTQATVQPGTGRRPYRKPCKPGDRPELLECVAAGNSQTSSSYLPDRVPETNTVLLAALIVVIFNMSAHGSRLMFFLLVSISIHVLVLATWQTVDRTAISLIDNGQPLQLTLSSRPQMTPASTPSASSKPIQTTQRRQRQATPARPITAKLQNNVSPATVTEQTPPVHEQAHAAPTPASITRTTTAEAHTMTSTEQQRPSLSERIQRQLLVKFAMHRHYPPMAVRNAWQGRVNLGLRVEADGLLSNIRVIKSSGYHILDQAAISSLGHVAALPEAGSWLQGRHIDVILPVIYKLTDS